MVTINGLTPAVIQKNQKAAKKGALKKEQAGGSVVQTTKVAAAVSQSIRQLSESELEKVQIQYDLPEGQSRKAMEEYMDIYNRSKKEELAKLIGVDIYI
ncbi:chromosome partitioning protein ParA [Vibrio algarum]|uniref:Chromosome partitioning protein ParA n=1 Tax=Vibrio algarum TaxID=3020714 RepID=A0ABT4YSH1_9VIBR|nr:chromosome partitioning protein ParA [Vibrio sp. KJ40-1]MDB1124508.1 chromosome partitioning protein ParA [Vibrio sp. KJ40-1]